MNQRVTDTQLLTLDAASATIRASIVSLSAGTSVPTNLRVASAALIDCEKLIPVRDLTALTSLTPTLTSNDSGREGGTGGMPANGVLSGTSSSSSVGSFLPPSMGSSDFTILGASSRPAHDTDCDVCYCVYVHVVCAV